MRLAGCSQIWVGFDRVYLETHIIFVAVDDFILFIFNFAIWSINILNAKILLGSSLVQVAWKFVQLSKRICIVNTKIRI